MTLCSIITASGSYIPPRVITGEHFLAYQFYEKKYDPDKDEEIISQIPKEKNPQVIAKLEDITGIKERRWVEDDVVTSDMAYEAARTALESSGIDKETLDYIIVANNFGDVRAGTKQPDFVPSIGSRVKQKLGINNPKTIPYDMVFGCPGWVQSLIEADTLIKSGRAKRILVIGADTLSRIADEHDRDCMIFADGAGAVILEAAESEQPTGILSYTIQSDTGQAHNRKTNKDISLTSILRVDGSINPDYKGDLSITMEGHDVFEYALKNVPQVVEESLDNAGLTLRDVSKVLLHQANKKLNTSVVERLFRLYGIREIPENIAPMTISWLGNSSVATVPTLYDLIARGSLPPHEFKPGEIIVFASVGAGMNINSVVYKVPENYHPKHLK